MKRKTKVEMDYYLHCILKCSSACGWLEFEMQIRFQRLDSIYFIVNYGI
jgi:hypothetical protein